MPKGDSKQEYHRKDDEYGPVTSEPALNYMQLDTIRDHEIIRKAPTRDNIAPSIGKRHREPEYHDTEETERRSSQGIRLSDLLLMAAKVTDMSVEDQSEFSYHVNNKWEQFNAMIPILANYHQAIEDPVYGTRWREAIRAELQSLIKFATWDVARRDDVYPNNVATAKWVFAMEYGNVGRVDKFNARLVVLGSTKREGEDFEDTFAPVIRLESLRVLFAVEAEFDMKAHLLDATNGFVGCSLDISNYKEIPQGLEGSKLRELPK